MSDAENIGYVYILEVSDIDLPVCKIGRTSKNPFARCAEINRSSTGDFLWRTDFDPKLVRFHLILASESPDLGRIRRDSVSCVQGDV